MIHIDTIHTLGQSLRAARRQLGLTQAQLALAAGVGLRFIVELEAGKPTLRTRAARHQRAGWRTQPWRTALGLE